MMPVLNYSEIFLNRSVGLEIEGYTTTHPKRLSSHLYEIHSDGSLRNSSWSDDRPYGVEVATQPLRNLVALEEIMGKLRDNGWSVDDCAGTHIHVSIEDFTEYDKAKLLRFGKGIERIMFMFVQEYRNGNGYCRTLHGSWRKLFWKEHRKSIQWEELEKTGEKLLYYLRRNGTSINNEKYSWMNVYGSKYPTVEFRLFHAVETAEEAQQFALMVHNIVEVAKESEPKELQKMLRYLYDSESPEQVASKFAEIIGLPNVPAIVGEEARAYMVKKLGRQSSENTESA
jgi:hypothetical protein